MKRIVAIIAIAAAMVTIASCEKYENGRPSKDVRSEFERMYPDAWDVEWEMDYGMQETYWEVSFETGKRPNGIDHTAWYDMNGRWVATETDILLNAVPQHVKDALTAEYVEMLLEDHEIEYYETPDGNFYRFDIYNHGIEIKVDVTEKGEVSVAGNFRF